MKVNLPLTFPLNVRIIIYRDFLCIFLYSSDNNLYKLYRFRLTQLFRQNHDLQLKNILRLIKYVEKDSGINFLFDGKLIPSGLSSEINTFELFTRNKESLSKEVLELFDKISERNFQGLSNYFENFSEKKYLYIDYDVDYIGIFINTNKIRVGGYWDLDFFSYQVAGLESFFESSIYDLDVASSRLIFDLIWGKVEEILSEQNIKISDIEKIYFGGVTPEYLDTKNTSVISNIVPRVFDDNHYEKILFKPLLK